MAVTNKQGVKRLSREEAIERAKALSKDVPTHMVNANLDKPVGWVEGMLPLDVVVYKWANVNHYRGEGQPWKLLVRGDTVHDGYFPDASFVAFEGNQVVRRGDTVLFYCFRAEYDAMLEAVNANLKAQLERSNRAPLTGANQDPGIKRIYSVDEASGRETLISADGPPPEP